MPALQSLVTVDLGKSQCRVSSGSGSARMIRKGVGAPGLAAPGGVDAATGAIRPLLPPRVDLLGVGAAGAWAAPDAAAELARRLADETGARVAVASDVVTAHAGALEGEPGVLLIAGTGAVALGVDDAGVRLIDGWGPDLGDLGSGSWLGREALRAVLRASSGLGPDTALSVHVGERVGAASDIPTWIAADGPVARRIASLAPLVLDAAASGDSTARALAAEAVRLLTASAVAAASGIEDVVVHGGLTEHAWFRGELEISLAAAGLRVVPAAGDALDGALLLARHPDLPHERFVHRAG